MRSYKSGKCFGHATKNIWRTRTAPWLTPDQISVPACEIQMDLAESLLITKFQMVQQYWWNKITWFPGCTAKQVTQYGLELAHKYNISVHPSREQTCPDI